MPKKILFFVIPILIIVIIFFFLGGNNSEESVNLQYKVTRGKFDILVTTTGELQAENSEQITAPRELRNVRVYSVKITDLVPEGTIVDSGDYVATLDRAELTRVLKDNELEIQKIENQIRQTELDTTLSLRQNREELINLKFAYEEAKIKLDQSKYEPPATIRQAEIDLIKSERAYNQSEENYKIKQEQAEAKINEVESQLEKMNRQTKDLIDVNQMFTINAPKQGMVIYLKERSGKKRQVGSEISPWDPVVATLPDLTKLISTAYINEVDISKIKIGQEVLVGVDAFADKKLKGKIIRVANVGEQKPNSDAKVFEIVIKVEESDPVLKPSMTTSNQILVNSFDDVLSVPIDAVFIEDDRPIVYIKNGLSYIKSFITLGESNENFVIIAEGINENDIVLLNRPE